MRASHINPIIMLIILHIILSVGTSQIYAAEGINIQKVKCKERKVSKKEFKKIQKVKKAINKKKESNQAETEAFCDDSWVVDLIIILLRQFPVLGVIVLIVALIIAACG